MELYSAGETEGLPVEALAASAGCGNPTALASLRPGETVIDFGSGGGIDCFLAARAVGDQGRVIGIDMTEDMIELARSNAGKVGLSNTEFFHAEMERTPIADDTGDILISNCVINLAPDKDAVFREAFRVLKPGGRLAVSDMVLVDVLPEEQTADTANWVACLAGAELKEVYLGRIADAGFADVEVVSETHLENRDGWRANVRSMNIKATKPAR
jgi:SAM-dependent methyltransferase